MRPIHHQEREQFKELFEQEDIGDFDRRFTILEVFLQTERHVTVAELTDMLRQSGHDFSPELIRETLRLMCHFGFAQKLEFNDGPVRYEHLHLGQHHDHLICTRCRRIIEFYDQRLESLQAQVASANGFHMLQHKMEIYGICDECLKSGRKLRPLTTARQGERLIIKDVFGGTGTRLRLTSMGLRIGDEIEVITNPGKGQLVIAVDLKRYVLGRGQAQKIMVMPADDGQLD